MDKQSKRRQGEAESLIITQIMSCMERELEMLMEEMEEILHRPTSRYELYPRIATTLRSYSRGKKALLNGLALKTQRRFEALNKTSDRERILEELDKTPWKEEEMRNQTWQRLFFRLKDEVEEEINESRTVLIPSLITGFSEADLRMLGTLFKSALQDLTVDRRPAPSTAA